ncbi:MAG: flagellar hook-associated protein FlgK [Phycisphaerae bacterium]|nr:flagellar hook-associated protein FlgK [Gemmatimonadaceae bacterium]
MASGLFGISRSALITHQQVLQTIGHNIANAETPGYSRQEAVLSPNVATRMSYGMVGTGVHVQTIVRKRDILLDDGFRAANGQSGEADLRRDSLTAIENVFGEPSDAGLTSALDEYWNSWGDLASTPSSQASRAVVQQRGTQVAQLLNSYDAGLNQQRTYTLERMSNMVDDINQMAAQVAELNATITQMESGGGNASDLSDTRDALLDRLSSLAGVRTVPQNNSSITVIIGNSTLVDGSTSRPLSLDLLPPIPAPTVPTPDIPIKLRLGNSVDALNPFGGQLRAMADLVNNGIPGIRSRLDTLASSLATSVNAAHTQGFVFTGTTLPGTAAGNFFDPGSASAPVSAATLRLSTTVATDINAIAVSADAMAPLDNGVGKAMVALRNDATTVNYTYGTTSETGSFLSFFRSTVTRLGLDVNEANDDSTVAGLLVEQADIRRQSVSGVNTDEELVQMLRVQQAYTAATKLIKTADEMLQTLLSLV